jgi:hypothetical protein
MRTTSSVVIRARSVTLSPRPSARGTVGSASMAALQARCTICAASGSQWTFHSVVGVVLPDVPNAPPM